MNLSLKRAVGFRQTTPSYFSSLINHCLSANSLNLSKLVHAHLIKLGFNTDTFLGNRCIQFYSKFGSIADAFRAFGEVKNKNVVSYNVCLGMCVNSGDIGAARQLFDGMPERDVVSWNSMISGYAANGFVDYALQLFAEMRHGDRIRPSGYTVSILLSFVTSVCHVKEIHGSMIRNGVDPSRSVVVGNSLINVYAKLGLVDYAFGVLLTMEELDVISWNSLISGSCKAGFVEMALSSFCTMRATGYSPDAFTISSVFTACSRVEDLEMGKQIFCVCTKLGFLSNAVVSSAVIDLFSKCNKVEDSVCVFEEVGMRDSAICNSIISSYKKHGFEENALKTFVYSLRNNLRPTEFTLSCVISCASVFLPVEQGSHLHSLVIKLGFETDSVVSTSLVEMYSKLGSIEQAVGIFSKVDLKDLICWNTMIFGLTYNGKNAGALHLFKELLARGPAPDHITLAAVLLACNYGGFLDEGLSIVSSVGKEYGIIPRDEHYVPLVEMMSRAGKLNDVVDVPRMMVLDAFGDERDLERIERVCEELMELEPFSSLPYLVLAEAYERRGKWESVVRVKKMMRAKSRWKSVGCSWVGIRNKLFVFKDDELVHRGGDEDRYTILRLLTQDMEDQSFDKNVRLTHFSPDRCVYNT